MKLVEMKCKNCGHMLKVEEGATTVTCEYCHTSYALDDEAQHVKYDNMYESGYEFEKGRMKAQDEENKEINEQIKNTSKIASFIIVIFSIIFIVAFVSIGYTIFKGFTSTSSNMSSFRSSFERDSFNNTFEMYSGTTTKFHIDYLLDNIVTNNKKNSFHTITVVCDDVSTSDPDEIVRVKQSLKEMPTQYEVSFDYSDGFIYKVVITEIEK